MNAVDIREPNSVDVGAFRVMRVSRRVVRSVNVGTKFTRDRRVKMALLPIDQARLGESLQGRCTRPRKTMRPPVNDAHACRGESREGEGRSRRKVGHVKFVQLG
jgi:hypothetical protein